MIKRRPGRPATHDHDAWRRLYDAGCGDAEIARQHGAHHTTVMYWRRKHGLPPVNERPAVSECEEARRLKLYRKGFTDAHIGQIVGRSAVAIWNWRYKRGLSRNT